MSKYKIILGGKVVSDDDRQPPRRRFILSIESVSTLSVKDLWPDEDWPDDPTVDDVEMLIEEDGGAEQIIGDWNLGVRCTVTRIG